MLLQDIFGNLAKKLARQAKKSAQTLIDRQQIHTRQVSQAPALLLVRLEQVIQLIPPLLPERHQIAAVEIKQLNGVTGARLFRWRQMNHGHHTAIREVGKISRTIRLMAGDKTRPIHITLFAWRMAAKDFILLCLEGL